MPGEGGAKILKYAYFLLFLILSVPLTAQQNEKKAALKMKTYIPGYRFSQMFPHDLKNQSRNWNMAPWSQITQWRTGKSMPVSYAQSSGELLLSRFQEILYFSALIEEDTDNLLRKDQIRQLSYLQRLPSSCILGLSISGSSRGFMPLLHDNLRREAFFKQLKTTIRRFHLKALDLDWEFPRSSDEKQAHLELMKDLRVFCDKQGLKLSMAVSRYRALKEEAYGLADSLNVMTYDFYGRHSTLESTKEAMAYLSARYKIPTKDLYMGIPLYGRIFSGQSPDYWNKSMSYRQIIENFQPLPSVNEAGGFFFNGRELVGRKAQLATEMGCGGCYIWEIGQDSLGKDSLIQELFHSFERYSGD